MEQYTEAVGIDTAKKKHALTIARSGRDREGTFAGTHRNGRDAPIPNVRWPIKRPAKRLKANRLFRVADTKRLIALAEIRPMAPKRLLAKQSSGNIRSSATCAVSCGAQVLSSSPLLMSCRS